MTFVNKTV